MTIRDILFRRKHRDCPAAAASGTNTYARLLGVLYLQKANTDQVFAPSIYTCPSLPPDFGTGIEWYWWYRGYGFNACDKTVEGNPKAGLMKVIDGPNGFSIPRKISEVPSPSSVMATADIRKNMVYYNNGDVLAVNGYNRHDSGGNICYLDGHVKSFNRAGYLERLAKDGSDTVVYYKHKGGD